MFLPSPALRQAPGINHGFFTRQGGVSTGIYATLNCGVGSSDDPALATENRARVQKALAANALLTLYQIHSPTIITVTAPWANVAGNNLNAPRADGMVSAVSGMALGILTADCAPVLLADPVQRVIGAAHAGWKGALGDICLNVTDAMCAIGAKRENIIAAVGPAIAQASYEVGAELRAAFITRAAAYAGFFTPAARAGFYMFDLEGFVAARLAAAGITKVDRLGRDTYAEAELFFSYRRSTHRREGDYGRQISAIMIKD